MMYTFYRSELTYTKCIQNVYQNVVFILYTFCIHFVYISYIHLVQFLYAKCIHNFRLVNANLLQLYVLILYLFVKETIVCKYK